MIVWSGLGINYGHVDANYSESQIDVDLDYLWNLGFRRIRVALPSYNSSQALHDRRWVIVNKALTKGFIVIYGVTCVTNFTDAQWSAFKDYVLNTVAPIAQLINNPNLELSLGNEEELKNNGAGAPDDATVQSDLRALGVQVKEVYIAGNLGYQADQGRIAGWVSGGIGVLNKIGFNCYDTVNNFYVNAKLIKDSFGDAGEITEFNVASGYSSTPDETTNANQILQKINIMRDLGLSAGYFFTYNHSAGSWGVADWGSASNYSILKEDGSDYRLAWQYIISKRNYFIKI